jgi:hypothetical protein
MADGAGFLAGGGGRSGLRCGRWVVGCVRGEGKDVDE